MKHPLIGHLASSLFLLMATCLVSSSTHAQKDSSISQELSIQPDSMRIYGTLQKPAKQFNGVAVLMIAGSGPTDRNGNQVNMRSDAYKQVADSLALYGIATLRYDKRFTGKSMARIREENLRFEDNVNVAKAWFQLLEADKSIKRIFILGHSEGSTVGMLLAQQVKAAGFISLAGPGVAADSFLRKQLSSLPELLKQDAMKGLDTLKAGQLITKPNPSLATIFRPSIQPYLIGWMKYDPQQIISSLNMPVLIVHGDRDVQLGIENATTLGAGCKRCMVKIIPEMNHILKVAPAEQGANLATYNKPELPLAPGLVPSLVQFVKK